MKFLLLFIVRVRIFISNKGSQKCSHSIDLYCNVLNSRKRKNARNEPNPKSWTEKI